jgi:hypothetical protein
MEASPNSPSKLSDSPGKSNSGGKKDSVSTDEEAYKTRLLESKQMRKKAEEDALLLANRIALLQVEEKKAIKKIEDTRKKAKEIMDLKARNAEQQRQKEELRRQREEDELRKMQNNKFQKQQSKDNYESNRSNLMMKLKNDVDEMRKTKKDTKTAFHSTKEDEWNKNLESVKAVRTQHQDLHEKKKKQMEETKTKARLEYEGKIKQELTIREQTEEKIARLERQEMELIQRLQNTQNMQKEAFDTLEKALGSNTTQGLSKSAISEGQNGQGN